MSRNVYRVLALLIVGALLLSLLATPSLLAAGTQRYVATTGTNSGPCTTTTVPCLTIEYALTQAEDGDTIQVASGLYPTNITLNKNVSLVGVDTSILDGNGFATVVTVPRGITVSISGVRVQNGRADFESGAGITNDGTLTLTNVTISENTASRGAGITNSGWLTIDQSIINDNLSSGVGGGGIANSNGARLTITESILSNNIATGPTGGTGGAIINEGLLTINRSMITGNFAREATISNVNGLVTINASTISGNTGGGLYNASTMTVTNSTISNNTALNGGGIYNGTIGESTVLNTTITGNSATYSGNGIYNDNTGRPLNLQNTILAANPSVGAPDCFGSITPQGHNLVGNNTDCTFTPIDGDKVGSDIKSIDPKLGPLEDNGGPTPTHALLPGSPAINAGTPARPGSVAEACTTTDQRGIARPQGVRCDIGAFEALGANVQPPLEFSKTVSSAHALPGDTVTFTLRVAALVSATEIDLTNIIPPGLLVSATSITGGGVLNNGQIRFHGSVRPGTPLVISYQARLANPLAPGTVLNNTAELRAAGQHYIRSAAVTVQDPLFTGTVVMLYANGDNNLSSEMVELLNNAEKAAGHTDTVVLAVFDGPDQDDSFLYRLHKDQRAQCPSYENPTCDGTYTLGRDMWVWGEDLANAEQLAVFIGLGYMYPNARMRVLSLIGHGGGWAPEILAGQPSRHGGQPGEERLGGMLWDDHPGTTLTTRALGSALRMATAGKPPLDLLYLDACGMAAIEVGYEIGDTARYILAVENWKWAAFPYDAHLRAITPTSTPLTLGLSWLDNETVRLGQEASDSDPAFPYPYTYSLIDTSQLSQLQTTVDALAAELIKIASSATDRTRVLAAMTSADCFDGNFDGSIVKTTENPWGKPFDNVCDLGHLAQQLALTFNTNGALKAAAEQVQAAVRRAVPESDFRNGVPWKYPQEQWHWTGPYGLSIFVPLHQDNWRRRYYSTLTFTQENRWDDFLDLWWHYSNPGQPIPDDPAPCQPPGCTLPPGPVIKKESWLPLVIR